MAAARPFRLIAGVFCGAALLVGAAGCLAAGGPTTPTATPSRSPAPTGTAPSTTASKPAVAPSPTADYPGTAQLYGEALLLGWRLQQFPRVGELVTPDVALQLRNGPTLEPNWVYVACQGAAGSSYCQFVNADGDAVTVRIDNQLLGRAHAISEVKVDQTTYSNNAVEYVKSFIEAWRNANTKRMATLANSTEVEYFTHYPPPGTYSTCATLGMGTADVRVYNSDGLNYTLTVAIPKLGARNAIIGHLPTPSSCT